MKPARLFIEFGGLAKLRPILYDAWSLYWQSDFGDTAIIFACPDMVEIAIAPKKGKRRHITIYATGSMREEDLDKQSLLDLLRFTDREFTLKAIEDLGIELTGSEADRLGLSLSGALPAAEVEMIYGEYTLAYIQDAGWALVGYNRDVDAAVGLAIREDGVYAHYTHGKKAIFLIVSHDGWAEVVEAPA
jgi:hypothetical protein